MIETHALEAGALAVACGVTGFLLVATLRIRREEAAYAQIGGDQHLDGQELVNR